MLAITITSMVLELTVPHGDSIAALQPLWGVFVAYVLSFVYIGISRNNHHHLFQTVHTATGGMLWANLHRLFWLSLLSVATGSAGENHLCAEPNRTIRRRPADGGPPYWIVQRVVISVHGPGSAPQRAIGTDWEGNLSPALYLLGVALSLACRGWPGRSTRSSP